MTVGAGEYAWKPVIVEKVAEEFGGLVLWLDAGVIPLVDLAAAFRVTQRHGAYTPTSQDDVRSFPRNT